MAKDVIIACDFAGRRQTLDFLDAFEGHRKPFLKIGMELFYADGPDILPDITPIPCSWISSSTTSPTR